MTDTAQLRTMMVDTQVRPADVTKFPIIDAMLRVPREAFVPDDKRDVAYADLQVDLGGGRVLLDPRCMGKLLDMINITPDDLVLVVGAGSGYGVALAAHLGQAVIGIEEDAALAAGAEAALAQVGADNAVITTAPLTLGDAAHGPYDVIVIEGGIEDLPQTLVDQLKEGGRIATISMAGALGVARLGMKTGGVVSWRDVFNATAPVLPGFAKKRAFAL